MVLKYIYLLIFLFFLYHCDNKRHGNEELTENLMCHGFALCGGKASGTKFIMLGDSWTDYIFGVPVIQTLRYNLENTYDYRITGATVGGQELDNVLAGSLHIKAIDEAGSDVRYVLISLGGNDLLNNPAAYLKDFEQESNSRLSKIERNLEELILTGDNAKIEKYKGSPMKWIIHGYDHLNPDNENSFSNTGCRKDLVESGFGDEDVEKYIHKNISLFNDRLVSLSNRIQNLYYINLRGTLGGPPSSNKTLMFDCIHPNSAGFRLITDRYVQQLKQISGEDK